MKGQALFLLFNLNCCLQFALKTTALPDGLAKTPVMGWNSWNAFGPNIDDELIRQTADQLISLGLAAAGYKYVNIDDGWSSPERNPLQNKLEANPQRFPSGIPALADYIHSKGLKIGIYGDAGKLTCEGFPGSRHFEALDAQTWAEWGIDYLKYDNCNANSSDWVIDRYVAMRDALKNTGRGIIYSLCEWGVQSPWLWASTVGHSWRTTADIAPTWSSILMNLDATVGLSKFAGPEKGWNDPDMLEIGNANLTPEQERSHFSLWIILKAPLLIGADLNSLNPDSLKLLKSKELIAVHQDELGVAGDLVWKQGSSEVYACPLKGGDRAVVLFSRSFLNYKPANITVNWREIGLPPGTRARVFDLIHEQDLGEFTDSFGAVVGPQISVAVRISPLEAIQGGEDWRPWHGQIMYGNHVDDDEGSIRTALGAGNGNNNEDFA